MHLYISSNYGNFFSTQHFCGQLPVCCSNTSTLKGIITIWETMLVDDSFNCVFFLQNQCHDPDPHKKIPVQEKLSNVHVNWDRFKGREK